MIGIKLLVLLAKLSFPIISVIIFQQLVPIPIANSVVIAQNSSGKDDPPDTGRQETPPTNTKGPNRGPCENISQSLTALAPIQAIQNKVLISQEKTKFWFYIPYERKSIDSVSLTWGGKSKNLPKPVKPGIVSFSLPSTLPLQNGKQYNLKFTVNVYCDDSQDAVAKPDSIPIKVQLQKFNPPPSKTATQKANIYVQNGYIFDALTQLAPLKKQNPNNPNWNKLLASMNLKDFNAIANKPIIDCCTSTNNKP